jgi:hypothetical protein
MQQSGQMSHAKLHHAGRACCSIINSCVQQQAAFPTVVVETAGHVRQDCKFRGLGLLLLALIPSNQSSQSSDCTTGLAPSLLKFAAHAQPAATGLAPAWPERNTNMTSPSAPDPRGGGTPRESGEQKRAPGQGVGARSFGSTGAAARGSAGAPKTSIGRTEAQPPKEEASAGPAEGMAGGEEGMGKKRKGGSAVCTFIDLHLYIEGRKKRPASWKQS